jgi:exopolysaccharide biosynthesis polyprenyl glycosylphosphotransferase
VRIFGSARREIGGHMRNGGRKAAGGREHGPRVGLAVLNAPSVGTQPQAADGQLTSFGPVHLARHRAAVHARTRARWMRLYQHLLVAIDLLAASLAVAVAFIVRFGIPNTAVDLRMYAIVGLLMPLAWVAVVAMNRAYEGRFVGAGPAEFDRLFKAFLYLTALVAFASYVSHTEIARGFVVVALPLALLFDLVGRYGARKYLHRRRSEGRAMTSMLLVGTGQAIVDFAALVSRDQYAGMRVAGACVPTEFIDDADTRRLLDEAGIELLGDVDSVLRAARSSHADTVAIVASAAIGPERVRWISWQLEGSDVSLVISPGLMEIAWPRLHIQPMAGLPLVHVEEPEFTGFRRVLKGAFDRVIAALALLILSPVAFGVALAVRVTSRGPVLFRQTRIGRNGKQFRMVKFRSMYVDAEKRRAELEARNVNADGLLFKVRDDPRITRVGRVIRKYSLDELPQLFNVVFGHMSLVGPRPPLPAEVAQYGDDMRRRLLVKPGITGLWQISGRNDLSWEETKQLDLRYVENWSLGTDLMILWKTPSAVARASGAY